MNFLNNPKVNMKVNFSNLKIYQLANLITLVFWKITIAIKAFHTTLKMNMISFKEIIGKVQKEVTISSVLTKYA